ncbi:YafY family protein [Oceanispirochaeta sp. M2]|nr:WYL domain-containing protein [Oceanispirochaeta sp. M2]MBF9014132.1 WYL domain-containing protein [Oceanispirochaeta sp. M2]NPD70623.1 WYL domain-containing protein [Oceanispirochaeta sp. M1]
MNNHFLFPFDSHQIRDSLNLPLSDNIMELTGHISYEMSEEKVIDPNLFHDLMESINESHQIRIKYRNLKGLTQTRMIEPSHLRNSDGQWYLFAWCHFREELRVFHVSRIIRWSCTDMSFEKEMKSDELAISLNSSFGIMLNKKNCQTVFLRFTGKAISLVKGKIWHEEQSVEVTEEKVDISFPVESYEEILRVVLSYHVEAEVLGPPEFRKIWQYKIQEMAGKFI